jgi:hypothetical protein
VAALQHGPGRKLGTFGGIAARAGCREPFELSPPQFVAADAKIVQDVPRIQPAFVAVGKDRADRVITDRLDTQNVDVALADLNFSCPTPCPRASAEGENTRKNPKLSSKRLLLSKLISSRRDFWRDVISTGIGVSGRSPTMLGVHRKVKRHHSSKHGVGCRLPCPGDSVYKWQTSRVHRVFVAPRFFHQEY